MSKNAKTIIEGVEAKEVLENGKEVATINPEEFTPSTFTFDDNNGEGKLIADLTRRKAAYCSFKPATAEDSKMLFNATNTPEKRLKEMINEVIYLKHVFVEEVPLVSEETGVEQICPRIVFIDEEGKSYSAVSLGVFSALKKLFGSFGTPDKWTEPLAIKVKQIDKGNNRNILTLQVV
jgi:hypothetical protein